MKIPWHMIDASGIVHEIEHGYRKFNLNRMGELYRCEVQGPNIAHPTTPNALFTIDKREIEHFVECVGWSRPYVCGTAKQLTLGGVQ